MTTAADLQKQFVKEVNEFNAKVYDGNVPKNFMEIFKKAFMALPPSLHKYDMTFAKKLVSKRYNEISFLELGGMINMIYDTPFEKLYDSIEEGIDTTIEFDRLQDEYNKISRDFQAKMKEKYNRLAEICGIKGSVPFGQPIAQA